MRKWIAGALALFGFVALAAALAWCSPTEPQRGTLLVTVASPGRGAQDLERDVVIPVEEAIAALEGVELRSVSREGVATVEIEYTPEPNFALIDEIRTRVAALALPDDIEPPSIQRTDLSHPRRWLVVGATAAANDLRSRIERLDGMGAALICGELEQESSVVLDPSRLAAHDLRVADVMRALETSAIDVPSGRLEGGAGELAIRATGGAFDSSVADLLVGSRSGTPVRLADVGTVSDGFAQPDCLAWRGGRIVALRVYLQSGAADAALDAVDAEAAEAESVSVFGAGGRIETGRVLSVSGTPREERWRLAERLGPELRALPGVRDVLLLVEDESTSVVIARETESSTADELRAVLETVASHPGAAYVPDGAARARVLGPERDQALRIADDLVDRLHRDPELLGAVRVDRDEPEIAARIDRAKMLELHADAREVEELLAATSDRGLSIRTFGLRDERRITVRVDVGPDRARAADLRVDASHGTTRLGDFVTFEQRVAPGRLLRCGGRRCVELEAFGDPSEDIDDTIERLETVARSLDLPPGYTITAATP